MILNIVRFEWRYHTGQLSYLGAATIFLVLGFFFSATGFGQEGTNVNSPVSIIESSGLLSLAAVFVAAIFCTSAVVRDRDSRMEEIIFSTAAQRHEFLLGRFFGAFLATATACSTSLAGLIIGVYAPIRSGLVAAPLEPLHYVYALATVILPNVFFVTVLLFAAAALTRSAVATYTTSIFIYLFYMVTALLTDSPVMAGANREATISIANALADPIGLAAYFAETRYWTVGEKNHRLLAITGVFMFNRLVWISAGLVTAGVLFRAFTFRLLEDKKKSRKSSADAAPTPTRAAEATAPKARVEAAALLAFAKNLALETRLLLANVPFLVLTLVWCVLAGIEFASDVSAGEYGASTFPAAGVIFQTLTQPLRLLGLVLIIYFSGEVVWRERNAGVIDVVNATPQSSFSFIAAKWLALTGMTLAVAIAGIFTGTLLQLVHGYRYVSFLATAQFIAFAVLPIAVIAAAAVLIHTLSPSRNSGLLLVLLLVIAVELAEDLDLHPLLQLSYVPAAGYSDMHGFRGIVTSVAAWLTHWGIAAAFLLYLASTFWRRGLVVRRSRPLVATSLGAFAVTGSLLFHDMNVVKSYRTEDDVLAWKAAYEQKYGAMRGLPELSITHVEATVHLFPSEERARTTGRLYMTNQTDEMISRVVVGVRADASEQKITLQNATLESYDREFSHYLFRLAAPLKPGATASVAFDLGYEERGLRTGEMPVTPNGTMMQSFRLFPTIGYRRGYEIVDDDLRRKYNLPARDRLVLSEEAVEENSDDWVTSDITLSTAPDEIAVVSGDLVRQWKHGGRNYFRYRANRPIRNVFTVASGRYVRTGAKHSDRDIEVYYDRAHAANVTKILDTTIASLAYQEENFGPYPHKALRITEIPSSYRVAGYAQPGVIYLGERRLFQINAARNRGVDVVARRVAHEVAHQWWGLGVAPAAVDGGLLITESLAKYSELVITERMFGRQHTRAQLDYELDRYLARRSSSSSGEPPLSRVRDEAHIYYAKGAIVLNAIRDLLGEETMNRALREFYLEHSGATGRATAAHLIAKLSSAAATDEHRMLIHRWMNDTAIYDLKVRSAVSRPVTSGFEVTAMVDAARVTFDSEGNQNRLPVGENVPFAILDAGGEVIHTGQVALRQAATQLEVIVATRPAQIVIDPALTRIDAIQRDNRATLN